MFIESYRQAHGQAKQSGESQERAHILVTREGNFYYILGGLALVAGFFLPAARAGEVVYMPFQALGASSNLIKLIPLIYFLGLSTTAMVGTGRFRKEGIPRNVLYFHTFLSVGLILGVGVLLNWGLVATEKRFGVTMMPLALLCWWPLFIRLAIAWLWQKRPFLSRLLTTTWIAAACNGLLFTIVILDMFYYGKYSMGYGLVTSATGTLMIMIGGIKNEHSNLRS